MYINKGVHHKTLHLKWSYIQRITELDVDSTQVFRVTITTLLITSNIGGDKYIARAIVSTICLFPCVLVAFVH